MSWRRLLTILALPVGVALLLVALARADLRTLGTVAGRLGTALPIVLIPGALWHLVRTLAWHRSFPSTAQPPFWRAFRVRLAAEAFSFVTIRGVAGEPLKVVLLQPSVPTAVATAAVALERIAYLAVTSAIVFGAAAAVLLFLPLSAAWFRVFLAVGTVAGSVTLALGVLLSRRSRRRRSRQPQRPVAAFIRAADDQLRLLVASDRRRLAALIGLEVAAYAAMCAEVWAVLWASGTTPTALGSLAIETFTRVASMVSAFIPANLGALEASNVLAAGMINAAGAAAALALVRRLRGLMWCVAGFACYPPGALRKRKATDARHGTLVIRESNDTNMPIDASLGGLPIGERIIRSAERAGFARMVVVSPRRHAEWTDMARRVAVGIDLAIVPRDDRRADAQADVVEIPAGVVPSPAHLQRLRDAASASPPTEADVLAIHDRADLATAERLLRNSIIKPTDGRVGRFNRRMSIPISVALIRLTRCPANLMSIILIVLGLYAGWLFSIGSYFSGAVAALFSLAASILDGCDGELARLQYQDSAFGVWLDTLGDYSYYLAIFGGLTIGTVRQTDWAGFWWVGGALMCGALLTFALLILLRHRITRGRPERLRSTAQSHFERRGTRWTALAARLSTVATRATMPYGVLAFAIAGALPALLVLAAIGANIYWICLLLELSRLLEPPRELSAAGADSRLRA
jgi:phosphatidylglycerophosphate synthase/uncharacterized membrane protein YbhN (UPF0104 family)